jgi:cell division septation protein DedD
MTDEGLHEVQLNGKQLVFLFMVGTVVAVVIFLCGVMVGRGLRPPGQVELAAASSESPVDPTAPVQPASAAAPTPSDGTPVSAHEALTYPERLESPKPVSDDLREAPAPPPTPKAARPAAVAAAAPKPEPPLPADLLEPRGNGFVVQVMAVTTRAEADTIARRLSAKGYRTFVTTTGAGSKMSYRVRVGKYDTQREAEQISARLQKEEQFKPWVTR